MVQFNFQFVTKPKKRQKTDNDQQIKRAIATFHSDHTPVEIQNMDMPQLQNLYEHGSPAERELANHILRARNNWEQLEYATANTPTVEYER